MNLFVLFILIATFEALLISTGRSKANKRQLPIQDRKLIPLGFEQIDYLVKNNSLDDFPGGLSNEHAVEIANDQEKLKTLLDLISEFHLKMKQVNEELNDGVSHLNTVIGITKKFK